MTIGVAKRRGLTVLAILTVAVFPSVVLREWARSGPIRKELLQSKVGNEYAVSILRLSLRDPARDARDDLAGGDRGLYCVGSYGCSPPGLDASMVDGMPVRGTATVGCVRGGGILAFVYRGEEERYLTVYNAAKVAAARPDAE
jgi:hypothetical protein